MKVLYDISVLGSGHYNPLARTGVARVVENIAYGLVASKECDLIFCESLSLEILQACLDYRNSNPRFKGIPLAHSSFTTRFYSKLTELYTMLDIHNKVSHTSMKESDKKYLIKQLMQSLESTSKLIKYEDCSINSEMMSESDIFHATFFPIPTQATQTNKIHKFLTFHDLIPLLYPHFCGENEEDRIKSTIDSIDTDTWVLCVSNASKNDLLSCCNNIDPAKVIVTHIAAEKNMFYPCHDSKKLAFMKKKYHIPEEHYVLGLSTLEPRKNLDHVIRCFAKLVQQENIKDLSLVLVGNKGWKYGKILEEISNHYLLKDRIILTGRVSDQDLAALYSGALAFVYPSFYEGFGLPPLEAMQCGVPVITSDTSSLPEVVGDAGIMLDPTDIDKLCHSILEIYSRPSLREAMSLKSLEQAKKFSWEKCTQETIAAYKKALL